MTEHSPSGARPSNPDPERGWRLLGYAFRQLGDGTERPALDPLIRAALDATLMERGFVICSESLDDSKPPLVEALVSTRGDGLDRPSRTVIARILSGSAPVICLDPAAEPALSRGVSVRSLRLRSVLGAPVPVPTLPPGIRAALILDSRLRHCPAPPELEGPRAAELISAFAAVAGLLVSRRRLVCPAPRHPSQRASELASQTPDLVGHAPAFLEMLEWVRKVAPYDLPVLISGESGSGKEGVARALHRASDRARGPFLAINCAAFPETLLESELFGAVRGAYTGSDRDRPGLLRMAHGGTLLLDEIGDMPLSMQAKLLRVLQQRTVRPVGGTREVPVDVRMIAATHRTLTDEVAKGAFRADLLYRIAIVQVRVPPLRERVEDLPRLAAHLIARLSADSGLPSATISPGALERLRNHAWPGNVRELQGVIVRGLLGARDGRIELEDLDLGPAPGGQECEREGPEPLERSMIVRALRENARSVSRAAARIGWSRQKLYRRMAVLGIERPRRKGQRS